MKIDELIEKYINGETTLEEEKALKKYLINSKVFPSQIYLKQIFKSLQKEKDDFIISDDDAYFLEKKLQKQKNRTFRFVLILDKKKKYVSYAAAIIAFIILSIFSTNYFISHSSSAIVINNENFKDNKEIALNETEKALLLVSSSIHSVYENIEKLEYYEESIQKLKILELINYYKQKEVSK